jgi:hypothetical protein
MAMVWYIVAEEHNKNSSFRRKHIIKDNLFPVPPI